MNDRLPAGSSPRTLITGGFGFLAAWIAAGLLRSGHHVVAVDNRKVAGSPLDLAGLTGDPHLTTVTADITRAGALDACGTADYVVHAAALLGVDAVRSAPLETLRVNIDGTTACLDYAGRQPGLRRFVLLSTSEVYGADARGAAESEWLAVRTDDPRWSYAVSKVTAESLTAAHGTENGLPYTLVRPFNVYGPLRGGSYAVGALARQAAAGDALTVHGDGRQRRAWCHAEDFANGLIRTLDTGAAEGEAFNIGDDRCELTVAELAERIREESGTGAPLVRAERAGPDIRGRRPDIGKARALLGYEPRRELPEGLRETVQWYAGGGGAWPLRLHRTDWPLAGTGTAVTPAGQAPAGQEPAGRAPEGQPSPGLGAAR
ncbi:NAD-dependent epimerase/dehydratase family protein [Streptomyces sp. ODS28]|uniref:NAD-dependent epimerase/dehydratase family protein n=1 Tax=Streptomyces sp. ODS28 TaxID=3136688 RepID=UPI0031EA0920